VALRIKFRVTSTKAHLGFGGQHLHTVELSPARGDLDSATAKFIDSGATGKIHLTYMDSEVADQFDVGAEFFVTIEMAP
jgi:hypothetical protein